MASVICTRVDLFPNATAVKCYTRNAAGPAAQEGLPHEKAITEATMTSGTCTFEGLIAGAEYTLAAEVSSKVVTLSVQAPASTANVAQNGSTEPAMQKLLAWTFDPIAASGTFGLTTAGTLYVVRLPVKESIKVSNILLFLTTKGATLTALENFIGLFAEGTRNLIANATAAETITKWEGTNNTLLTIPLVTPAVVGPGNVLVGMYYKGTTKPTFAAAVAQADTEAQLLMNAGVTGNNSRFATGDAGLTTALPNPITSPMVAANCPIWAALT
jgi:hypothetical protein